MRVVLYKFLTHILIVLFWFQTNFQWLVYIWFCKEFSKLKAIGCWHTITALLCEHWHRVWTGKTDKQNRWNWPTRQHFRISCVAFALDTSWFRLGNMSFTNKVNLLKKFCKRASMWWVIFHFWLHHTSHRHSIHSSSSMRIFFSLRLLLLLMLLKNI